MTLAIGEPAPAFTLRAHDRSEFSRDALLGRRSLVVFMPFAFTRTCTGEICTIRDQTQALGELDANVVVITCDTRAVNERWVEENGFTFPVLSDFWPHGEVTKAYGAFNELYGAANRRTVVLDENGVVRQIIETDALGTPREFDEYIEALEEMGTGA